MRSFGSLWEEARTVGERAGFSVWCPLQGDLFPGPTNGASHLSIWCGYANQLAGADASFSEARSRPP